MEVYQRVISLARRSVGQATYQLKAPEAAAPMIVDCSSFVQWVYGQVGFELPRLAYQQFHRCCSLSAARLAQPGDLVFKGGSRRSYYQHCPLLGIDHVGILTDVGTVVHAASTRRGVVEESVERFCKRERSGSALLCAGTILIPKAGP